MEQELGRLLPPPPAITPAEQAAVRFVYLSPFVRVSFSFSCVIILVVSCVKEARKKGKSGPSLNAGDAPELIYAYTHGSGLRIYGRHVCCLFCVVVLVVYGLILVVSCDANTHIILLFFRIDAQHVAYFTTRFMFTFTLENLVYRPTQTHPALLRSDAH